MRLILKSGKEFILSDAEAKRVQAMLNDPSISHINLGKESFSKFAVDELLEGGLTEADIEPDYNAKQIEADKRSDDKRYSDARKAAEIARENLKRKGIFK